MKKSLSIITLTLIIVVFGFLAGYGYYYFFLHDDNIKEEVLPTLSTDKIKDVKNGIYIYKTNMGKSRTLLKSCVVDSINDYLVVINENYYLYRGNCLNTVFVGQGLTEKLKFEKDNDSKYTVQLDNITYNKDNSITKIVVDNNVIKNSDYIYNYDNLKAVIDYSEYNGYYYSFKGLVLRNEKYRFKYDYDNITNSFQFSITKSEVPIYYKVMNSFNDIPNYYILNDNLAVLDNNKVGDIYKGELYIYSGTNKTYDYNSMFPLIVNGETIDSTWNRIFKYDSTNKIGYVLFSKSNDFCDFDKGNYYEFKLYYDYKKLGFKAPDLSKKGTNAKDCSYVKNNYLREG